MSGGELSSYENVCLTEFAKIFRSEFEELKGLPMFTVENAIEQACNLTWGRGILISSQLHVAASKREKMCSLSKPKYVERRLPPIKSEEYFEFQDDYDLFRKNLDLGYLNFKTYAQTIHAIENKKRTIEQKRSVRKCSVLRIPAASLTPDYMDVKLGLDVVEQLKSVEMSMHENDETTAERIVFEFLSKYGSHIHMGKTMIGGVYIMETSSPKHDIQVADIEQRHNCSVSSQENSLGVDLSSVWHTLQKDNSSQQFQVPTNTSCYSIGGPESFNILPLWQMGVLHKKINWVTIDKDFDDVGNFLGIWWILMSQFDSHFKNPLQLSLFLRTNWINFQCIDENSPICQWDSHFGVLILERLVQDMTHSSFAEFEDGPFKCRSFLRTFCAILKFLHLTMPVSDIEKLELSNKDVLLNILTTICTKYSSEEKGENQDIKFILDSFDFGRNIDKELERSVNKPLNERCIEMFSNVDSLTEFSITLKSKYIVFVEQTKRSDTGIKSDIQTVINILFTKWSRNRRAADAILLVGVLFPYQYEPKKRRFSDEMTLTVSDLLNLHRDILFILYDHKMIPDSCPEIQISRAYQYVVKQSAELKEKILLKEQMLEMLSSIQVDDQYVIGYLGDESFSDTLNDFVEKYKEQYERDAIGLEYFECFPEDDYTPLQRKTKQQDCITTNFVAGKEKLGTEFSNLLITLGLTDYYPGKIGQQDVILVRESSIRPNKAQDLPWVLLEKLHAMDCTILENIKFETLDHDLTNENNDEDPFDSIFGNAEPTFSDLHVHVHPQDIFLATYISCDPVLRCSVATKMAKCQMALPFIHSDFQGDATSISLSPLLDIYIDKDHVESVVKQRLKTISFIRIGECSFISKSKCINQLLRDRSMTNTFMHRECLRPTDQRNIYNGVVEISWFVPDEKDRISVIKDERTVTGKANLIEPLTILNLRGDAYVHTRHFQIVIDMSNTVVVFIDFLNLNFEKCTGLISEISRKNIPFLIVTSIKRNDVASKETIQTICSRYRIISPGQQIISVYNPNSKTSLTPGDMREKMVRSLNMTLKEDCIQAMSLEEKCCELLSLDFDEKNKEFKEAKEEAFAIYAMFGPKNEKPYIKETQLPLQNQNSLRCLTEHLKMSIKVGLDVEESDRKSMYRIRETQIQCFNNSSESMSKFIRLLVFNINRLSFLKYILLWLARLFDSHSNKLLPNLRQKLNSTFERDRLIHDSHEQKGKQLMEAEHDLSNASCGVEHLLREVAQVYESVSCSTEANRRIKEKTMKLTLHLPFIAAKLLISGYPFEILDGDAGYLPEKWIKAVFCEVENILGNKSVLVISVLGIQSSGKSTLLNTMFGLNFAVSAGRCTRGAFMQLVPVDHRVSDLQFDYALIVDTEGLRSSVLGQDKYQHDNELATFIIGMADIVIVNIKGETLSDMEEILQIVVFGLMRIKQANKKLALRQTCIFVHQNVSAHGSSDKLCHTRQGIIQNLDQMTKEVAQQENMFHINAFGDVIKFNHDKHIMYIPDLWFGLPPMATISQHYSQSVREVLSCIMNDLARNRSYMTFEDVEKQMCLLWKAILSEDFAFSFRNCLEVKAYSLLEAEFQELLWTLDKFKIQYWETYFKPALKRCETFEEFDYVSEQNMQRFSKSFAEKENQARETLLHFIDQSRYRDQMNHIKAQKLENLKGYVQALCNDIIKKANKMREEFRAFLRERNEFAEKQTQFSEEAVILAKALKDEKPSDIDITEKFNTLWSDWIDKVAPPEKPEEQMKRRDKIEQELSTHLESIVNNRQLLSKALNELTLDFTDVESLESCFDDFDVSESFYKYRNVDFLRFARKGLKQMDSVRDVAWIIFVEIDHYFKDLGRQDVNYDFSYFRHILDIILTQFRVINGEGMCDIYVTNEFLMCMYSYSMKFSIQQFTKISVKYEANHGLRSRLEQEYKEEAHQFFKDIVEAKNDEIVAAHFLSSKLQTSLRPKILNRISLRIQSHVIRRFGFRKYNLMKTMLADLSEKDDFKELNEYICNTQSYTSKWLSDKIDYIIYQEKSTDGDNTYSNWINEEINASCNIIINTAQEVSRQVTQTGKEGTLKRWLDQFCSCLEIEGLQLHANIFDKMSGKLLAQYSGFTSCLCTEFKIKVNKLRQELLQMQNEHDGNKILWPDDIDPYKALKIKLLGCPVHCPWCGEPCTKMEQNHENEKHVCIQHRPTGFQGWGLQPIRVLSYKSCNFLVGSKETVVCREWCECNCQKVSHKYKEYSKYMPDWSIQASGDQSASLFWNYMFAKHVDSLVKKHTAKKPKFPESWCRISRSDAVKSLDEY